MDNQRLLYPTKGHSSRQRHSEHSHKRAATHFTNSPCYPQTNGKAEQSVWNAKSLLEQILTKSKH